MKNNELDLAIGDLDINDVDSDASYDSDDETYGCGTHADRINAHLSGLNYPDYTFSTNLTQEEISANPNKFYYVLFRGSKLDYFNSNQERREHIRDLVLQIPTNAQKKPLLSIGFQKYLSTHIGDILDQSRKFENELQLDDFITDKAKLNKYKTPTTFQESVKSIGKDYGNPAISTSRLAATSHQYADTNSKAILKPKYDTNNNYKAKHRTMGSIDVIVIEANEYEVLKKADIEKLRKDGKIGNKCAVERENQEIIFHTFIPEKFIAGTVFIHYPSFHKPYNPKYLPRYGIDEKLYNSKVTKPKSGEFGPAVKIKTTLSNHYSNQAMQIAYKSIKEKNALAEPICNNGNGQIFVINTQNPTPFVAAPARQANLNRLR